MMCPTFLSVKFSNQVFYIGPKASESLTNSYFLKASSTATAQATVI